MSTRKINLKFTCLSLLLCVTLLVVLSACQSGTMKPSPTSTYTPPQLASPTIPFTSIAPTITQPAATTIASSNAVRTCDFVPGKSVPALIQSGSTQPGYYPTATLMTFNSSPVDQTTLSDQERIFNQIVKVITDHYYSADYNGVDWKAIQDKYKALIGKGLKQADFYKAMNQMVAELGDNWSVFLSASDRAQLTGPDSDNVGIGAYFATLLNDQGKEIYVLAEIVPGSPAAEAGLKNHDMLLKVDGLPFMDENSNPRTLGPAGSTMMLTVQTPGQDPRDITVARRSVSKFPPIDICLVARTQIGYLRWLDFDNTTFDQTIEALKKLSADSPLQGLIIDLRLHGGTAINKLQYMMSLFTSGELGSYISPRGDSTPVPFVTNPPRDIFGSQELPLVVLQDQYTFAAPLIAGVLQLKDRARIVGQTAPGNVYNMYNQYFLDGSNLYLANQVFQPAGKSPDYWNKTGVIPDVIVDGRWDQFTEANDPYIAKAIDLLMQK